MRLANRIRDLYTLRRRALHEAREHRPSSWKPSPHWDGGHTPHGNRKNIWVKIAKFCLRNGLEPEDYIYYVFSTLKPEQVPQPNHLLSERLRQQYIDNHCREEERLEHIRLAFTEQKLNLMSRLDEWTQVALEEKTISKRDIQLAILGDDGLGLTALFRFCLAIQEKLDDVAQYYFEPAVLQYLRFRKEYQEVWGDFLPTWLDDAAMDCKTCVLSEGEGEA